MAFDALPSGVRLVKDLVDPDQEAALLAAVEAGPWENTDGHRLQQFGWRGEGGAFSDGSEPAAYLGTLPDWAAAIVSRVHVLVPFDYAPDHIVVRDMYADAAPVSRQGEARVVASLTLLGDLSLVLRRRDSPGTWHLRQPRRSLLVLTERFDRNWDRQILPAEPSPDAGRILTVSFRRGADA